MLHVPVLETPRLTMRALTPLDFDAFAEMSADGDVMRFLGGPISREDAWRQFAMLVGHWTLRGFGSWAVESRRSEEFIGRVGFHQPEGWPGFELGWAIAREHWGQGYATEAAKAALEYGFGTMGKTHVISLIHPENHRSLAVARRLGETFEGEAEVRSWRVHVYGVRRE
jgi:RimJ/RimL family protein N-acetyltransferase